MATQLIYKNLFGNPVTLQQAQQLGNKYSQEQHVDGSLKRIDRFSADGEIERGVYYLSDGEDLQQFLNSVADIWNSAYIYTSSQVNGQYTTRNWEIYVGTRKIKQGQTLYDEQGREIARQVLDININEILETTKVFYLTETGDFDNDDDILDFGTIMFNYNFPDLSPGEIEVLVNLPGFETRDYIISDDENILLHSLITPIFSWENETYYHSATPFIPNAN